MHRKTTARPVGESPTPSPETGAKGTDNPHLGSQDAVIRRWFTHSARELPWRQPPAPGPHPGGWGVLVSEFMLQQTPVDRVLPEWSAWLRRWPQPSALAAESSGEAIRAWGRLGYPRRALRIHEAATRIASEHDDLVPADDAALRALPGIGDYTAGAVRAFAYGQRALALDTNVRRVIARHDHGRAFPEPSITRTESTYADSIQPTRTGAAWMAAVMELGALVCTARQPACERCPVASTCRWLALGRPEGPAPRRQPKYAGSDRQARGALLAVLREAGGPVRQADLDCAWPDAPQRARALDGLVADGLVAPATRGRWSLPG
jgi:A/G-specific adenine glycosylase